MGFVPFNQLERNLRRLLERAGGILDFSLRRSTVPQTDFSTLIPRIESAIEKHLRDEGGRLTAPDLIELRYDYETWTSLAPERRDYLKKELAESLYEYTYNRRYALRRKLRIELCYDAFTRGVEIRVDFSSVAPEVSSAAPTSAPMSAPVPPLKPGPQVTICLIEQATGRRQRAVIIVGGEPAGVGRNIANALIIRDPTISNFHAAFILRRDGLLEVADRGSANGTMVNGVMLANAGRTTVRDGDLVRFGDIDCRLETE